MFFRISRAEDLHLASAENGAFGDDIRWEFHPEITEDEIRRIFLAASTIRDNKNLLLALAEWCGTPADTLSALCKNESEDVRRAVSLHINCLEEDLRQLLESPDPVTRQYAEWNLGKRELARRNLSAASFWEIYRRNDGRESHQIALRYEMTKHPDIPIPLLEQLSRDSSPQVRGPAEMRLRSLTG